MIFSTLITVPQLISELDDSDLAIIDCRFSLTDPESGRQSYLEAHIPGAVYAHLDEDLSSPVIEGKTGRHPLPSVEAFSEKLGDWGINSSSQIVVYDDAGGALAASRFWWLLQWLGHYSVAVLDGGWQAWLKSGGVVSSGLEERASSMFIPRIRRGRVVETDEILKRLGDPDLLLIDSRADTRYSGEEEPIDPVAGHIPGAQLSPHSKILGPDGIYLPKDELRRRFQTLFGERSAREAVFYCGSGVTAAQNVLAVAHAGLGEAKLYAGSWSEWIIDPNRPVATGME
jgi:thiosulfate/3-mercaptopyruvate sulfurtransferase